MAAPLGGTALPDVFVPPPGTPQQAEGWEVVLLVDQRETRTDRGSAISFARLLQGARAESRQLPLGDMVWIARPRSGSVPRRAGDNEHVLSYVVERKRMQDLAASVFDGRYAEQKRRLRESGIARVLYLVEGRYSDTERIEASRLISACANTQVKTGFFVLHTRSEDETADVLAALHKEIERQFAQHLANGVAAARRGGSGSDPTHGYGLSFQAYRTRGARSQARTARQVLATMLRQVRAAVIRRCDLRCRRDPCSWLVWRPPGPADQRGAGSGPCAAVRLPDQVGLRAACPSAA